MRRFLLSVVCAVAVVVAVAAPASAKMPPFTVEVLSAGDAEPGVVTIRVVLDERFSGFDAVDLDGLIAAFPRSSLTSDLRPRTDIRSEAVAIPLELVAPRTHEGVVRLPELQESWIIVPFPTSTAATQALVDNGYPAPLRVASADAADSGGRWWWALGPGAIAVGSVGLFALLRRTRSARAMCVTGGSGRQAREMPTSVS